MHCIEETIIRPNRPWWELSLREFAQYRDLLWLLVHRDIVAKYKQTILGPLWFVIQPLLTTLVFTVIFGKVAKIPTDGIPPVLFYLCGLLGWNYFAQTFSTVSGTFTTNANLFGKVYFPRLVIPLSALASNLVSLALNLLIFACFWIFFRFWGGFENDLTAASSGILLLPLLVMQAAIVSLACGLWMATLTAKYRDLSHLTGFLVQLLLYATPVIYPLSQVSDRWIWLATLNPMTLVIEGFRFSLLGTSSLQPSYVLTSLLVTFLLLASSLISFKRVERTFIDTI